MKTIPGFIFILVFHFSTAAQNAWSFQKEKDGIRISTRHAGQSSFNDVKVEVNLPGNTDQLVKILMDIPGYTEWAYATKVSRLVKETGPGKLIYYSEVEVPWPATNRYYYANFELTRNPQDHSVQVISVNLPDYTPVPKELVKVPFCKGSWNITTISPKQMHIEYILQIDPGGSLPAWVINLFSSKGPLETFENIKKKMTALNPGP